MTTPRGMVTVVARVQSGSVNRSSSTSFRRRALVQRRLPPRVLASIYERLREAYEGVPA